MKILLLCKKFPYPLKDGESIAIHNLSKALAAQNCEVSILAMNTHKHYFKGNKRPAEMDHYQRIETVDVDNRIKIVPAFKNLFSSASYHIERFISKDFELKLQQMLQEDDYQVVQLETLYLAPYVATIRKHSDAIVSMRAHNVEHEIWDRITSHTDNIVKRWYLRHLTEKLKRYEISTLNLYDIIIPITKRDSKCFKQLGCQAQAVVTPIGITPPVIPAKSPKNPKISMSFIGSLDWMPNIEGLNWFVRKVWPQIHEAFPELEFHIAGRNTPKHLFELNKPNIFVHGEVPESIPFVNAHELMVVPLLSGSGMRAKILEGMALNKVVLSTSIGLEGIIARNKKEVLVANTPDQFVESLRYVLSSENNRRTIADQAKTFVHHHYDNTAVGKRLYEAYAAELVAMV